MSVLEQMQQEVSSNDLMKLTASLKGAEEAHAEYEKGLGHRDDNWAEWYARWILSNQIRTVDFW